MTSLVADAHVHFHQDWLFLFVGTWIVALGFLFAPWQYSRTAEFRNHLATLVAAESEDESSKCEQDDSGESRAAETDKASSINEGPRQRRSGPVSDKNTRDQTVFRRKQEGKTQLADRYRRAPASGPDNTLRGDDVADLVLRGSLQHSTRRTQEDASHKPSKARFEDANLALDGLCDRWTETPPSDEDKIKFMRQILRVWPATISETIRSGVSLDLFRSMLIGGGALCLLPRVDFSRYLVRAEFAPWGTVHSSDFAHLSDSQWFLSTLFHLVLLLKVAYFILFMFGFAFAPLQSDELDVLQHVAEEAERKERQRAARRRGTARSSSESAGSDHSDAEEVVLSPKQRDGFIRANQLGFYHMLFVSAMFPIPFLNVIAILIELKGVYDVFSATTSSANQISGSFDSFPTSNMQRFYIVNLFVRLFLNIVLIPLFGFFLGMAKSFGMVNHALLAKDVVDNSTLGDVNFRIYESELMVTCMLLLETSLFAFGGAGAPHDGRIYTSANTSSSSIGKSCFAFFFQCWTCAGYLFVVLYLLFALLCGLQVVSRLSQRFRWNERRLLRMWEWGARWWSVDRFFLRQQLKSRQQQVRTLKKTLRTGELPKTLEGSGPGVDIEEILRKRLEETEKIMRKRRGDIEEIRNRWGERMDDIEKEIRNRWGARMDDIEKTLKQLRESYVPTLSVHSSHGVVTTSRE